MILQTKLGWMRCTGLCLLREALTFLSLCWSALRRAAHFHKVLLAQRRLKSIAAQARQIDVIIKKVHRLRLFWAYTGISLLKVVYGKYSISLQKVKSSLDIRFVIFYFGSKTECATKCQLRRYKLHWRSVIAHLSINKVYWHLYNRGEAKHLFHETPLFVLLCHFLSNGTDSSQFQVVKASMRRLRWKSIGLNGSRFLSKEIQFCLHSSFVISSLCRANCLLT